MAMWMQVVIIPFLVAFICVWLIHPAIAKMAIVRGWIKRSMPTHFTTVIIHPIWGENRLKTA